MNKIVSTTMSKHGIGRPNVNMRTVIMMRMMVTVDRGLISTTCKNPPPFPRSQDDVDHVPGGIDAAKDGRVGDRISASLSLLSSVDSCYTFVGTGTGTIITMLPVEETMRHGGPYTKLSYISSGTSPIEIFERAMVVVSMVEAIDRVTLTAGERLMASIFFFASIRIGILISK